MRSAGVVHGANERRLWDMIYPVCGLPLAPRVSKALRVHIRRFVFIFDVFEESLGIWPYTCIWFGRVELSDEAHRVSTLSQYLAV